MKDERRFLLFLIIISIIYRTTVAIIYTYPPSIPHDFYAYIAAGKTFMAGTLYDNVDPMYGSRYGVIFAMMMGGVLQLFGENFVLLKIPSLISGLGIIVVFYYIVRDMIGVNQAKYATIFWSFLYITIIEASLGQDDDIYMFFMMVSLYYIFKGNYLISALFVFISAGFKPTALVLIPPMTYYVYRTINIKSAIKFFGIIILLLLALLIPHGVNAFYVYSPLSTIYHLESSPLGSNYFTLYHYFDYYFNYGIDSPYENYISPTKELRPFTTLGLLLIVVYLCVVRLKDPKIELTRNIFVILFGGVMTAVQADVYYIFWYIPFLIIMYVNYEKDKFSNFKLDNIEIIGIILTTISIFIHTTIYRWNYIEYTSIDRLILLSASIMAGLGTLFILNKLSNRYKYSMSIIMMFFSMEIQVHAYVLEAFGSIIPILSIKHYAWGILTFISILVLVIVLTWTFIIVHNTTKDS